MANSGKKLLRVAVEKAKRFLKRKPHLPEEDPYAYVTAPRKPRAPFRFRRVSSLADSAKHQSRRGEVRSSIKALG